MLKKYNWLWTIGNLFGLFSSCWYSLDVDDVAVICNNAVLLGWVPIVTNYLGLEKQRTAVTVFSQLNDPVFVSSLNQKFILRLPFFKEGLLFVFVGSRVFCP